MMIEINGFVALRKRMVDRLDVAHCHISRLDGPFELVGDCK